MEEIQTFTCGVLLENVEPEYVLDSLFSFFSFIHTNNAYKQSVLYKYNSQQSFYVRKFLDKVKYLINLPQALHILFSALNIEIIVRINLLIM